MGGSDSECKLSQVCSGIALGVPNRLVGNQAAERRQYVLCRLSFNPTKNNTIYIAVEEIEYGERGREGKGMEMDTIPQGWRREDCNLRKSQPRGDRRRGGSGQIGPEIDNEAAACTVTGEGKREEGRMQEGWKRSP